MATETEARWLEGAQQQAPRFIESEGVWAVTYQNEFDLEVERFQSLTEAEAFCRALSEGDRHD